MTWHEILFWLSALVVFYTYVGYPLFLMAVVTVRGRPLSLSSPFHGSISVVLAAYNEDSTIDRRVRELNELVANSGLEGEILVVSDGSTDRTAEIVRSFDGRVQLIELPINQGKANALNIGCAKARGDILVFADARQRWAPDALERLLENFSDNQIGAVSGDLILTTSPGVVTGVGFYWKFEKWLRRTESRLHSTVGVTGSICAVRRSLFRPIPPGTILDDVYWPLLVVMQGFRVIHDERAHAYDQLPERSRDEFRRKVRTLSGNFQLLNRLPTALLPWRNPISWQFLSHKICRLMAPWALLGMLATNIFLEGTLYQVILVAQVMGYLLALIGTRTTIASRSRLAAAASSFLLLNTAAWLAFWIWISGRATRSWEKIPYQNPLSMRPEPVKSPGSQSAIV